MLTVEQMKDDELRHLRKEVERLRDERETTSRRLAAAMHEVSFGSATQVFDLAEIALKHWYELVHKSP